MLNLTNNLTKTQSTQSESQKSPSQGSKRVDRDLQGHAFGCLGETVPNTYLSATPRIYQRRILLYGVPERNVEDLRTPGAPRFAAPFQHQARAAFRSPFLPLRADFRKILQNLRSYTGHQNGIQSVESIRVPEGDSGIKKRPKAATHSERHIKLAPTTINAPSHYLLSRTDWFLI